MPRWCVSWLVALSLGSSCAHAPLEVTSTPLTALSVEFDEPGSGRLHFRVPIERAGATRLHWELAIDGYPFASGLEAVPAGAQQLEVDSRLVYRHLPWREGARFARVHLKATLTYPSDPTNEHLEGRAEVVVHGAPRVDGARE